MFYRNGHTTSSYVDGGERTNPHDLPVHPDSDTHVRIGRVQTRNVGDPMPAAKPGPDGTTATRDARRLSTLLEVSQALSGTLNLKSSMQRVIQILIRHHGVVRG